MSVPATVAPKHLDDRKLAELAYELARDLKDAKDIYRVYGITEDQFKEHVEPKPFFQRVLEAAVIEWAATGSTKTRIKFQAALALEQGIIPLTARMMDDEEDLGKAVETAKLLAKIAGLDTPQGEGGPGEKFTITINLGADQIKVETIDGNIVAEEAPAAPRSVAPVLQITQGERGETPVQRVGEQT